MKKRGLAFLLLLGMVSALVGCAAAPAPLVSGESYVTERCLYINPLRSASIGRDDLGLRFVIGDDSFSWQPSGEILLRSGVIENVVWEWQSFPYTDESWNALFEYVPESDLLLDCAPVRDLCSQYGTVLYQPLQPYIFLLSVDGALWLVQLWPNDSAEQPWLLFSVYSLIPEKTV